ncbi:hypothetical protein B0H14DRAFT_3430377 [Mycena olivaceomarginata]|nr:hypothetical protein B0H14DRAFT_3430377 [Mycena olivaceomarginata]
MQWNAAGITTLEADARAAGATTILAFNEPDLGSQANMTPESAASSIHPPALGEGLQARDAAVTNGGAPTGLAALVGGWIDDFTEFIEGAKKYGKPIYLTEFGLAWDADAQASDYEEFLPSRYLDSEPSVAKYAFFGAFNSGTGKDMIAANGTLTALGKMYIS